ncbi:hypothetical protein [Paenarthrobacter sp. NPDC058040]|uniref:hypothetical protein n=1 Tax=unclassified Paenarthrobacter TaxID=2634190 RepID=UPI0036D7D2D7
MTSKKSANNYWLGLSAACGVFMALSIMMDFPWLWLVFGAMMLFLVLQAMYYGQIGRGALQDVTPRKGSATAFMPFFFPLATLIRGSDAVVWAAPLLGIAGFAVSYACLRRDGYFYRPGHDRDRI